MYCSNSKCRLTIDSHWDRDEATAVVRCPRPHRANEASGWADLARSQGIELRQNTAGRLQETLARGR